MFNSDLFEFAEIYCGDDVIPAHEECSWDDTLKNFTENNLRVDKLYFKPRTNQLRFTLLPRKVDKGITKAFNVSNPPISFLRQLWEIGVVEVQQGLKKFMVQGYKEKYDNLPENDKTWLTVAVLGGKSD